MKPHIAFIGAGNMSSAMFGGLIRSGYPCDAITATSPDQTILEAHRDQYAISITTDNALAAAKADILVLAVKPQILKSVCLELAPIIQKKKSAPLIISIAAGISIQAIENWLQTSAPIVRCMPNTPALYGVGASGLFANTHTNEAQKQAAESLLKTVGLVEWVAEESLLNAVTAISGSAPAYFFLMLEAMEQVALEQGLPITVARRLAAQTALGAAHMTLMSNITPAQLKQNVMSPEGSTEQAILAFEHADFRNIIRNAMNACFERAIAMQTEFGHLA